MMFRSACVLFTLTMACGDDGGGGAVDAGRDAPTDQGGGCPRSWSVTPITAGATAQIANGTLILRSPTLAPGGGIDVVQEGLTGVFDIAFQLSSFASGGDGAYVRASVKSANRTLAIQFRTTPDPVVESSIEPDGISTTDMVTTPGPITFHFSRTAADKFEMTAKSGDGEAGVFDLTLADSPLSLHLSLGAEDGSPTAETSAVVEAFEVTQGNLAADPFDCDSLR